MEVTRRKKGRRGRMADWRVAVVRCIVLFLACLQGLSFCLDDELGFAMLK